MCQAPICSAENSDAQNRRTLELMELTRFSGGRQMMMSSRSKMICESATINLASSHVLTALAFPSLRSL